MLDKPFISEILKPKSEEELGDAYREMKQKTNKFMTKIFSDLHEDHKYSKVYVNSKGKWMFEHNLKNKYIYVSHDRVWSYFHENITSNYNIIKMLIEGWLKENTDWPQLPTNYKSFVILNNTCINSI